MSLTTRLVALTLVVASAVATSPLTPSVSTTEKLRDTAARGIESRAWRVQVEANSALIRSLGNGDALLFNEDIRSSLSIRGDVHSRGFLGTAADATVELVLFDLDGVIRAEDTVSIRAGDPGRVDMTALDIFADCEPSLPCVREYGLRADILQDARVRFQLDIEADLSANGFGSLDEDAEIFIDIQEAIFEVDLREPATEPVEDDNLPARPND